MRDDGERLQDILEAIAQVEKYSVLDITLQISVCSLDI